MSAKIPEHGDPIAELNYILQAAPPNDVVMAWYAGLTDADKTAVDSEVRRRVGEVIDAFAGIVDDLAVWAGNVRAIFMEFAEAVAETCAGDSPFQMGGES
jgi:hypothetical protein